jgi:hypothetical protein
MNEDIQTQIDSIRVAVQDAADKMREAKAIIDRQNEANARWQALVSKAHAVARDAIAEVEDRDRTLRVAKQLMLEQAVRYENEQLYYSHHDSENHELCRIANERLNGVYSVMPVLFKKTPAECIDLVRTTAAEGRSAE